MRLSAQVAPSLDADIAPCQTCKCCKSLNWATYGGGIAWGQVIEIPKGKLAIRLEQGEQMNLLVK